MTKARDLTDWRFGKLVAIGRVENDMNGKAQWVCRCDCGEAHIVRMDNLTNGRVKKCPACEHVRVGLTLDLYCYVTLIEHGGGYVQGSAGFVDIAQGTRHIYRSPWHEARHTARYETPVLIQALRGAAKAGVIRTAIDGPSLNGWIRRHKADINRHAFNEGEQVWSAWYARTSEWKGPQQSEQQLDTIMSSLRVKSA